MIARVAKAIREGRQCGTPQEPLTVPCPFCEWEPHKQDGSETGCVWLARAAISAMREPTEAMYLSALRITRDPDHGHIPDVVGGMAYRAMIDAALAK